MKVLFSVLLGFLAGVSAKPAWHELDNYSFDAYVKDFGKVYESSAHKAEMESNFYRQLDEIKKHNADTTKTWKVGVNHMTDWSEESKQSNRGVRQDLLYKSKSLQSSQKLTSEDRAALLRDLPAHVDWREKSVVTPVKDQGQCGSCWTFAASETIESHVALHTGHLNTLSQQNILDCVNNVQQCGGTGGCAGGTAELAFAHFQETAGIAAEWTYPYQSYFGDAFDCRFNASKTAVEGKVTQYVKLESNAYEPLMNAVANIGPLAITVDASKWSSYEGGVFDGCNQESPELDHAVQLVGYGTDDKLGAYWLVRNSWSPTWGENGYIRLKRDTEDQRCGTDSNPADGTACAGFTGTQHVCGTCGILFDTVYPIVY